MTGDDGTDEVTTAAVVGASAELLERLNASQSPLSVVSESLTGLATALGVDQALVAIDDAQYGRQVFCSGRALLGDSGDLLWGPPRVRTDPPHAIDESLARLIVAAVTMTFERARTGSLEPAGAPTPRTGAEVSASDAAGGSVATRGDDLVTGLAAAVDRCARYGWGFTLVLMRLDEGDDETLSEVEAHLRSGDTLFELGTREYGILLAAAAGDEVPSILARVGRGGTVSTFCYGLATCPGDASDAAELLALATARLRDAESTRHTPEIHALDPPLV
jgi:hypothetical protein